MLYTTCYQSAVKSFAGIDMFALTKTFTYIVFLNFWNNLNSFIYTLYLIAFQQKLTKLESTIHKLTSTIQQFKKGNHALKQIKTDAYWHATS